MHKNEDMIWREETERHEAIPDDYPVVPLNYTGLMSGQHADRTVYRLDTDEWLSWYDDDVTGDRDWMFVVVKDMHMCGFCGLGWDDGRITSITPAPSGRCPFETYHKGDTEEHEPDDMMDPARWGDDAERQQRQRNMDRILQAERFAAWHFTIPELDYLEAVESGEVEPPPPEPHMYDIDTIHARETAEKLRTMAEIPGFLHRTERDVVLMAADLLDHFRTEYIPPVHPRANPDAEDVPYRSPVGKIPDTATLSTMLALWVNMPVRIVGHPSSDPALRSIRYMEVIDTDEGLMTVLTGM